MGVNGCRRYRGLPVLLCLVLFAVLSGCSKPEPDQTGKDAAEMARIDAIRALPYISGVKADKDVATGVVFHNPDLSWPGYSLVCFASLSRGDLIDLDGNVIRSWSFSPGHSWWNCELLPNGDLLAVGAEYGKDTARPGASEIIPDDSRYVARFDWEGNLLWKRNIPIHHDIEETPDGKLLVLSYEWRIAPGIHPTIRVRDDHLTLLEPDGSTIDTRSLLDAIHGNRGVFRLGRVRPYPAGGSPWIDLFHLNSIEWMHQEHLADKHALYDPGNILLCSRNQNRIAIVNWDTHKVVWAWGEKETEGPHDAQILESGNILLFDNGFSRGFSRIVELDPVANDIVWQYKADPPTDFLSPSRGSAQRLPNGNTLIAESDSGKAFEVTYDGEKAWEFVCPYRTDNDERGIIARIKRYSAEQIDVIHKERERLSRQNQPAAGQ